MTNPDTETARSAAAVDLVLTGAGWRRIITSAVEDWPAAAAAYEDPYSVVGVWAFPSLSELVAGWTEAQAAVTELISTNVVDIQQKAWDGYLLLITPARVIDGSTAELNEIRSNTRRLRKLVITGDELGLGVPEEALLTSVRSKLAPLLPVSIDGVPGPVDPLADLPHRLALRGIDAADVVEILEAHSAGLPMVAALHDRLARPGDGTDSS